MSTKQSVLQIALIIWGLAQRPRQRRPWGKTAVFAQGAECAKGLSHDAGGVVAEGGGQVQGRNLWHMLRAAVAVLDGGQCNAPNFASMGWWQWLCMAQWC